MRINKHTTDYWASAFLDAYLLKKGYFVLGYTKSGTNWMRNLISAYFKIDDVNLNKTDVSFFRQRVHHMHRFLPSNYFNKKCIYMLRDGRDTIISRYFTMVRQESQSIMKEDFIKWSGVTPSEDAIKEQLALYIKFLEVYSKSSIDWKSHLTRALANDLFTIRYEDMLANTAKELKKVIQYLEPTVQIEDNKIQDAIDYCSIAAEKKKKKRDTGFFRKDAGKKGSWKDYFNLESATAFENYAGGYLVEFGYEEDSNWINEFS